MNSRIFQAVTLGATPRRGLLSQVNCCQFYYQSFAGAYSVDEDVWSMYAEESTPFSRLPQVTHNRAQIRNTNTCADGPRQGQ